MRFPLFEVNDFAEGLCVAHFVCVQVDLSRNRLYGTSDRFSLLSLARLSLRGNDMLQAGPIPDGKTLIFIVPSSIRRSGLTARAGVYPDARVRKLDPSGLFDCPTYNIPNQVLDVDVDARVFEFNGCKCRTTYYGDPAVGCFNCSFVGTPACLHLMDY